MWYSSWMVFVAKSTDMFHKVIIFILFLTYLFVLGNCQLPIACTPVEREQLVSQKINVEI